MTRIFGHTLIEISVRIMILMLTRNFDAKEGSSRFNHTLTLSKDVKYQY